MRRIAIAFAFLVLLTGSLVLLNPRIAHAFTILVSTIYFDPVSVTPAQTIHVHIFNHFMTAPVGVLVTVRPTVAGLGSTVMGPAVTLNMGDGTDQSFSFLALSPTPGTTRIPVVCDISFVPIPPATTLPLDFSGRVATSAEIIDDVTGRPTEITTTHHVLNTINPCVFCN